MAIEKSPASNKFKLLITLLGVYILLFEFILPVNKVLPRPVLLLESFSHIWNDYNLLSALTSTATVVYLGLLLGFMQIFIGISRYMKYYSLVEDSILILRLFTYLTLFFSIIIFTFWFPQNTIAEYVFAFFLSSFFIFKKIVNESKNVNEEYLLISRNLKLSLYDTIEDVHWKASLPALFKNLKTINSKIWVFILMYEFIGNAHGIGFVYRTALKYSDFTALFSLAILCGLLIWLGDFVIGQLHKKYIHWTA